MAISHDSYCFRVNIGTLEISRSNNYRIKSNASTNTWVVLEAKALAYRENAAGIRFQEFQSLSHVCLKKKKRKKGKEIARRHTVPSSPFHLSVSCSSVAFDVAGKTSKTEMQP